MKGRDYMESRAIKIKASRSNKISMKIIPGHFATNHSHINYYIDLTRIKTSQIMATEAAKILAEQYVNTTPVETIVCIDGVEIIGGFLATELTSSGYMSMNSNNDISVVTPEYNSSGQMIFRDNLQPLVWNRQVVLLVASTTTGKTIKRSLECIKYYGGKMQGISAIFSAINDIEGIPIDSIFTKADIPNYTSNDFKNCPECKNHQKIDAIVNSYGYSKL